MVSENYVAFSTGRLEAELAKLTEHLGAFPHSHERREQINREIRLVTFELRYRDNLLSGQMRELESHFR